jgi:hypothetical protein
MKLKDVVMDDFARYVVAQYTTLKDSNPQDAALLLRFLCYRNPELMREQWMHRESMHLYHLNALPQHEDLKSTTDAMDAAMWRHVGQPLLKEQENLLTLLAAKVKRPRYNHACFLGFEVLSDTEDGDDITIDMLREALHKRIDSLNSSEHGGEWLEACLPPNDTYEM